MRWFKRRQPASSMIGNLSPRVPEPIVSVTEIPSSNSDRPAAPPRYEAPPYRVCWRLSAALADREVADGDDAETATERHNDRMAALAAAAGEQPSIGDGKAPHAQDWLKKVSMDWHKV
jgi:hypothetical protein